MTQKKNLKNTATASDAAAQKRSRVEQTDVPSMSLNSALRVPQAMFDNYAGGPITPLQLAKALDVTPTSGGFRMLCGAASAYGLTSGGYNSVQITGEALAQRIFRPLKDGDDVFAKREAFLKPRVIKEFLEKYNGHALPTPSIAQNVLASMGVPTDRTQNTLELIMEGAEDLGLLSSIKDKKYVQLGASLPKNGPSKANDNKTNDIAFDEEETVEDIPSGASKSLSSSMGSLGLDIKAASPPKNNKVFVTHGKNKDFVEPIKQLLVFGKFDPIVSVERQSTSKPVPDKVMDDMRSCSAAIIHVDAEMQLKGDDDVIHAVLNPNVLIEIGAAMALYGKQFILLVREGVKLPSNLQGLYEVRYNGDTLNAQETIRLLSAINEMSASA